MIALAELSVAVTRAGGIGFFGSGNDQGNLEEELAKAKQLCEHAGLSTDPLPIGIGFLNWGADMQEGLRCIKKYRPCAIWLFAPRDVKNLADWSEQTRLVSGVTKIWIQVGTVTEAEEVVKACKPDVLVVQGGDAGGHGLNKAASIVTLVPEAADLLARLKGEGTITEIPYIIAAGGISDGRGVAAALALGAQGVCMGTRFLAAHEAVLSQGYRNAILGAEDGGQTTARSSVYDQLRGTTDWPKAYGGRGVVNKSFHDAEAGMDWEENTRLYGEAMKRGDAGWGSEGRMTTYAGTGVGLVNKEQRAAEIVEDLREESEKVLAQLNATA
jgi:nitronate monooxygenase